MEPNTKEALSVLQKEFAEKFRKFAKNPSSAVPKIKMNIDAMKKYNLDPIDFLQVGPFSCRDILIPLGFHDYQVSDNQKKALLYGFIAETFSERGFDVNFYNIVPETGEIEVQNLKSEENERKQDLQLSTWDKFWGFFGIETANVKAMKGFEEAKAREAEFARNMKTEVEQKAAEVQKIAGVMPEDLSDYPANTAQVLRFIKKGDYQTAIDLAEDIIRNTALEKAKVQIKEQIVDNKDLKINKKKENMDIIFNKASMEFASKFSDRKYRELGVLDKALTLANIIKNPDLLDEVSDIKLFREDKLKQRKIKGTDKIGMQTTYSFTFKNSDKSLSDCIPAVHNEIENKRLINELATVVEEEPENENDNNEL